MCSLTYYLYTGCLHRPKHPISHSSGPVLCKAFLKRALAAYERRHGHVASHLTYNPNKRNPDPKLELDEHEAEEILDWLAAREVCKVGVAGKPKFENKYVNIRGACQTCDMARSEREERRMMDRGQKRATYGGDRDSAAAPSEDWSEKTKYPVYGARPGSSHAESVASSRLSRATSMPRMHRRSSNSGNRPSYVPMEPWEYGADPELDAEVPELPGYQRGADARSQRSSRTQGSASRRGSKSREPRNRDSCRQQ